MRCSGTTTQRQLVRRATTAASCPSCDEGICVNTPIRSWDATVYEQFAEFRARPAVDLLARVGAEHAHTVVDLGCGSGASTWPLAERWPDATIIGVDSSADMLDRARGRNSRITWVEADVAAWEPPSAVDVFFTNALLQWVPNHLALLPHWIASLAPGGWFALQVPWNTDAPNYALLQDAVAGLPEAGKLLPLLRAGTDIADPVGYAEGLHAAGCVEVDVWETTYLHVLDPDARLENPVLEWMRGTGLRPVLGRLSADR